MRLEEQEIVRKMEQVHEWKRDGKWIERKYRMPNIPIITLGRETNEYL
ncbi:hypothetical protein GCM10010965_21610 [Caldalkalibacillus thermarum]|nr:hypothetical protein [Caldalkalibacillus thermarum]GGK28421.1 hypothetical protein GCM10010965_21610 [Caldalkalibacillus thermarum]